ncbi:HAD family hydrolase [Rhizobium sp. LC145]|uniref:HAD family hydrolase n=1 Tax=Rhizobium sp. LC145 TaxID=1120688 RepID=UPI000B064213|nr:HAD family hydrolase [Rhizobium sp. LC145]
MNRTQPNTDNIVAAFVIALVLLFSGLVFPAGAQEPLPSWKDAAAKGRIMEFVEATVTEGGGGYVAPDSRIAVFDNDGTLWSEQPNYIQFTFMLDRVKTLAPLHPEWKVTEPFKSILAGDPDALAKGDQKALMDLATSTHAGMTTDEFDKIVVDWFAVAKHPTTGKSYEHMTYLPMQELLTYLRKNGFRTFIVSGGGVEFMRPVSEKLYGIPPEQVIGSTITTEYAIVGDVPVLKRLPKIEFINDGKGKPAAINKFIGRKPIFVAGNSDGDYEMLRWVSSGNGPSFAMILHHTDTDREVAYDRKSDIGRLDMALDEAERRNWLVVDMKADWNKVFAFEK